MYKNKFQVRFVIMKFDRGSWRATPLSLSVDDACKILYDKNQYWYQFWTEYITNADEIKDNCLNVPGVCSQLLFLFCYIFVLKYFYNFRQRSYTEILLLVLSQIFLGIGRDYTRSLVI